MGVQPLCHVPNPTEFCSIARRVLGEGRPPVTTRLVCKVIASDTDNNKKTNTIDTLSVFHTLKSSLRIFTKDTGMPGRHDTPRRIHLEYINVPMYLV